MKKFNWFDQSDVLPNFGYVELQLLPDHEKSGEDIENTTKRVFNLFNKFRSDSMRTMAPQFFDVLITDECQNVNTKFTFSINPQNSTASSFHLLRIQITNGAIPMVDAFRNLPDDQLLAMFSHALGLMIHSEE